MERGCAEGTLRLYFRAVAEPESILMLSVQVLHHTKQNKKGYTDLVYPFHLVRVTVV